MTMLIALDSDNRASLRRLLDRYPCLHGNVAAVIEGGMGKVFADSQQEPHVALAVLDFHFLAGDPLHANALLLFKLLPPGAVVIALAPAWQHLLAATYPNELTVYHREAFQAEKFDDDKLRRFCQALPSGFVLRQVRLAEVMQFATDLDPALVYAFFQVSDHSGGQVGGTKPMCKARVRRSWDDVLTLIADSLIEGGPLRGAPISLFAPSLVSLRSGSRRRESYPWLLQIPCRQT